MAWAQRVMLQAQPVRKEAAEHQRVGSGVASARPRFPGARAARSPRPVGSVFCRFPPSEAFLRPRHRAALAAPAVLRPAEQGLKDKKGVGGLEMQTTMYKINKQQGYMVQAQGNIAIILK